MLVNNIPDNEFDEDLDEFEALENHVNSLHYNTNNDIDNRISVSRR